MNPPPNAFLWMIQDSQNETVVKKCKKFKNAQNAFQILKNFQSKNYFNVKKSLQRQETVKPSSHITYMHRFHRISKFKITNKYFSNVSISIFYVFQNILLSLFCFKNIFLSKKITDEWSDQTEYIITPRNCLHTISELKIFFSRKNFTNKKIN